MASALLVIRDRLAAADYPETEAMYRERSIARARSRGRQIIVDRRSLVAYVNNGQWVADCPHCRTGIMLDPDWSVAYCYGSGCYRSFTDVIWPEERVAIEAVLADRPMLNQHWGYTRGTQREPLLPAETVDDLKRENDEFLGRRMPRTEPEPEPDPEPQMEEPIDQKEPADGVDRT